MAVDYIEDIVQNIITRCDMSGFEDYNKGIQEINKNMSVFNTDTIKSQKQKILLTEAEMKSRIRLADYEQSYALRKEKRDLAEIKRMGMRNGLQRQFMKLLGLAFSIATLKNIVDTGSRLQLVQKSIEGLTKSTQDWKFLQDEAFKTGTDIEVVAKGYRNFYSSAKMAGFDKSGIQQMYADVLLSTRAIGATTQQTEGALLALEQMISKGTVSMEELRRQLGNALPGAFEIGAKAMNMTTMEFNKFVRTGKLASAEFVPKFIKALKETYADGFASIEQTVSVAQIRLSNAWKNLSAEIISGETGKALAQGLNELAKLMVTPEFKQFITYLGYIFTWVVKIFTFVIKNMKLVLMLFGVRGFYGLLFRNRRLWIILNSDIRRAIPALLMFGKAGIKSFLTLNTATKAFLRTLGRVIVPLLLIEDLIFFIGEMFLGWNTKSAIGSMVAMANQRIGRGNLGKNVIQTSGLDQEGISKHIDHLVRQGKFDEVVNFAKATRGVETYSGIKPIAQQGMIFDKDEKNEINVRIENVNIGNGLDMSQVEQAGHLFGNSLTNTLYETTISKGGAKGLMGNNYSVTPIQGAKTMLGSKQ